METVALAKATQFEMSSSVRSCWNFIQNRKLLPTFVPMIMINHMWHRTPVLARAFLCWSFQMVFLKLSLIFQQGLLSLFKLIKPTGKCHITYSYQWLSCYPWCCTVSFGHRPAYEHTKKCEIIRYHPNQRWPRSRFDEKNAAGEYFQHSVKNVCFVEVGVSKKKIL